MNNFFRTDSNPHSFSSIDNDGSSNNNPNPNPNPNTNNNNSNNSNNNTNNNNYSSFNSNNNSNNDFNSNSNNNSNNNNNNNNNNNTNFNTNDNNNYNPNFNNNFNNPNNNNFNPNNNFNTFGNYNTNSNANSGNNGYNGSGNNNSNSSGANNNSNAGVTFQPQQGIFSSDYGQQQQLPPFSYQPLQNQQYQQQTQQQQPYFQQPYQQQQQQQQQQYPYGTSDNSRPFMSSDAFGGYSNTYPSHRPDNMGQEGPTRSLPRGTPTDNGHSARFNPTRNHGLENIQTSMSSSTATGTFLARPKVPGQPCIACNMSRTVCDGGSPCRSCHQNRVRCHYEGDNNTRFFEIESLQLDQPLSGSQSARGNRDNRDNPDNLAGRAPAQAGSSTVPSSSPSFTASSPSTAASSRNPPSRSRSRSGSGSVGSGSGSGTSSNTRKGHDSSSTFMRVSPVISSPIMFSDQSLISIPPFQEVHQDRAQHNRVTLPSISSMGTSIVPLSSAGTNTRTPSSSKAAGFSATPRSTSSSSSNDRDSISGPGAPSNKAGHDRSAQSVQTTSSSRAQIERSHSDTAVKRSLSKKQQQQQRQQQNQSQQKNQQSLQSQQQQQPQAMPPKDPLYSLSSASIRARKNALEMENIQRASHAYTDYIAKIKDLSVTVSESTPKTTPTYLSERDMRSYNRMDLDSTDRGFSGVMGDVGSRNPNEHTTLASMVTSSPRVGGSSPGEGTLGPTQGLARMGLSGMLHSLVQQYFTLIHPQFMILHKNRFLVRFWAQYGSFPEANELQIQVIQNAKATNTWRGPVDGKDDQEKTGVKGVCPLLLLAMLALVSRHINDRSPLKSSAADKQQRVEHSLSLLSKEFQDSMKFMLSADKTQEARLQELMEPDNQSPTTTGECLEDRGEQYFQWASELLKAKYEEPSLTVVQSLLLLREYAIMAGNHTQAYMYGGTAITMAMGLGWHHAGPTKSPGQGDRPSSGMDLGNAPNEAGEAKVEGEESKELKATDEEQKLCWWHCFIVDRWISAIYNRPVNIPIHIFDKTLLPLPKVIRTWDSKDNDGPEAPTNVFSSTNFTTLDHPSPDAPSPPVRKTPNRDPLSIGSGVPVRSSPYLPSPHYRAKAFFDQQCRQALLLDDVLSFLSSWSDDLFVSSVEFEKLSQALDDWHQALADWQSFPLSGIVGATTSTKRQQQQGQRRSNNNSGGGGGGDDDPLASTINADEGRDVVQATLLGVSYHTVRILLYRPFLRTNMRHPPCLPSRASAACAQSANAMTSLAEYLMNQTDTTAQPCLLMRHQFPMVTAAGIQQMNSNLDEEPRLSTPAKINLLKTIRILRDADRSSWGAGVRDGLQQVLQELFPAQMKHMWATA